MMFNNYNTLKVPSNADCDVVNIQQFLPEAHHGSIIITTQSSKINIDHHIKVSKLEDICNSLQILSNASHCEGVIDGELICISADVTLTLVDPDVTELAKELNELLLILTMASIYLDQVATSFAEYLCLYRVSWLRLQHTSSEVSTYEDQQLYLI